MRLAAIGEKYRCNDCGYMGALVIEADDEMIESIIDEHKKKT